VLKWRGIALKKIRKIIPKIAFLQDCCGCFRSFLHRRTSLSYNEDEGGVSMVGKEIGKWDGVDEGSIHIGEDGEKVVEKKSLLPDNHRSTEKEQVHNLFYSNLSQGSTVGKQLSSNREKTILMSNPTKKQTSI
jgi:hypothetical protein